MCKGEEDGDPEAYLKAAARYVEEMYAGPKAALRPIHDRILELAFELGNDVKACPCKTIVPLYRNHVFAQIKPTTRTRIDLGFALGDTKATGRLIDTGGFAKKDRITHRIPISSLADIDNESAEKVVVVNETFAKRYLTEHGTLGEVLKVGGEGGDLQPAPRRSPGIARESFRRSAFRRRARQRTYDAMRRRAEAGAVTGGTLYGYTNVRDGGGYVRRVVNETEGAIVRRIFTMYAEGAGIVTIAQAFWVKEALTFTPAELASNERTAPGSAMT